MAQHSISFDLKSRVWASICSGVVIALGIFPKCVSASVCAQNTLHLSNAGTMLFQRPRRWPNIQPVLSERVAVSLWGRPAS